VDVPKVDVEIISGFHVPEILLLEVVGKAIGGEF
jgi:hypothetical protein